MPTFDKDQALSQALALIEKKHGKGTVMRMGDRAIEHPPVIPTGCIDIDYALGIGGVPRGRIVEIFGPESSGKTTIALHIVAEAQKLGGTAAFIDAEHALDPVYAKNLGVDINNLVVNYIEVEHRNYKDYMYYGPIPYSETLKYSNLEQNKGW